MGMRRRVSTVTALAVRCVNEHGSMTGSTITLTDRLEAIDCGSQAKEDVLEIISREHFEHVLWRHSPGALATRQAFVNYVHGTDHRMSSGCEAAVHSVWRCDQPDGALCARAYGATRRCPGLRAPGPGGAAGCAWLGVRWAPSAGMTSACMRASVSTTGVAVAGLRLQQQLEGLASDSHLSLSRKLQQAGVACHRCAHAHVRGDQACRTRLTPTPGRLHSWQCGASDLRVAPARLNAVHPALWAVTAHLSLGFSITNTMGHHQEGGGGEAHRKLYRQFLDLLTAEHLHDGCVVGVLL